MSRCEKFIYSEEYADYIFPYYGELQNFEEMYGPDCFQEIGGGLAIVFDRTGYEENTYGYGVIPKCYGLLDTSNIESIGVGRVRRQPYLGFRGRGVLIGILDTGIEYTHPAFLNADGTTRIAAIWDQTAESIENINTENREETTEAENEGETVEDGTGGQQAAFFYGTEYTREMINEALQSENPYRVVPQRDENGHGTAMAGIIAGNEIREDEFSGVVPLSTLLVVKLKQAKRSLREYSRIPEDVECFQETDLLFGVYYLLRKAKELDMPMVIYLGVGTNQGSHTGDTALAGYLEYFSGVSTVNFVAAAGNETNLGHHTYYSFQEDETYRDVELRVDEGQTGFSLEIWGNSADLFMVEIISPAGESTGKVPMNRDECYRSNLLLERVEICTSYYVVESYSLWQLILVRFFSVVPGNWRIRVYNDKATQGSFHIWLPMEGFIKEDTRFLAPVPETVICDPGNGQSVFTVGAYNHFNGGIYLYSSRGYTADGQVKPDLVSAGVEITAPDIPGGYRTVTGTSAAAAHVAGLSAILWEWGIVEGFYPDLRGGDIKRAMIMGAERRGFLYPNREFGYGIANIYGVFDIMRDI